MAKTTRTQMLNELVARIIKASKENELSPSSLNEMAIRIQKQLNLKIKKSVEKTQDVKHAYLAGIMKHHVKK
jgi:hypothetical protein